MAAWLLLWALGAATPAGAAEPALRLSYQRQLGAERCPSEAALRQAIATRLGHDPFDAAGAATLAVEIGSAPRGLRAHIALVEGPRVRGARTLISRHRDCRALAAAVELAVAIAVDPRFIISADPVASLTEPTPAPSPAPGAPPPVAAAPPHAGAWPSAEPTPAAGRSEPLKWRATIDLAAALEVSAALRAAPSLAVQLALGMSSWSFGIEARGDLPSESGSGPRTVSSWLVSGAVVPCARPGFLVACALLVTGAESARITMAEARQTALYFAVGARGGVELPLHRWLRLDLHVDALWALSRLTLDEGGTTVFETAPASLVFAAGLVGVFP